ncbi:MAG: transposase [Anaerolineae bacterium]|nr:transposase [Anaerolineae bacterium]
MRLTHGHERIYPPREIVNAILLVLSLAYVWRMLPHDFPVQKTVITPLLLPPSAHVWRAGST